MIPRSSGHEDLARNTYICTKYIHNKQKNTVKIKFPSFLKQSPNPKKKQGQRMNIC